MGGRLKMKTLIYILLLLVFNFCISEKAFTQHCGGNSTSFDEHSSSTELTAPHGGILQKAGKYYIELVVNMLDKNDKISVYLLNKSGIPKDSSNISATISFIDKKGDFTDYQLLAKDEQQWGVKADITDNFRCNIVFKSGKKTYSSIFDYNDIEYQNAGYHCPMHPEISSKTPGTCSKCGMDLIKNNKI